MRVLYVGSGAVNICLAGWMHSAVSETQFLVRLVTNPLIKTGSFSCLLPGDETSKAYSCKAFASLEGIDHPDLIVVGVKNYSLPDVLDKIESEFGNEVPVMSVLNGVEHINQISSRFNNAIFATIVFNAYRKSPTEAVAVGSSLGLSAINPKTKSFVEVHQILKEKTGVSLIEKPKDAALCKLIINLGNALLTITGFHDNRDRELNILQKLTAEILNEG